MIIHMLEVHQMVLKTNMCSLMVFVLSGKPLLKTYRVLLECMTVSDEFNTAIWLSYSSISWCDKVLVTHRLV